MSIYAIKDGDGNLHDASGELPSKRNGFIAWTNHADADTVRQAYFTDGHVVELVEKAEPVEVSRGAGKWLADLREELAHGNPANSSDYYVDTLKLQHDMSIEDIFRALDVGWTVKQPRRWYIKAPKEWSCNGIAQRWFYKTGAFGDLGAINTVATCGLQHSADEQFSAEEIDKYHLNGFETVEVED